MKDLTERKQKILKAVVDEYIENASPVSSGEIKAKHLKDISSATIRNELSALEEMGYLIQPHTSAGRVPSRKAYGLYVDKFLVDHPLTPKEIQIIEESFNERFDEVQDLVKRTAKVITDVTNYTSVIVLKNIDTVRLREIKLVGLDEFSALLIIITDNGIIRDKVIAYTEALNEKYIAEASMHLNAIFAGKMVGEITSDEKAQKLISAQFKKYKELYENIIKVLKKYATNAESNVYLDGEGKFLEYPDQDIYSTKDFLEAIDSKERIADIINNDNNIEFSVKIGKDESGGIEKCAVVTAKYKLKGKEIGHAGVIGPERMDYSKVMSVLSYIGKTLDEITDGGKHGQERLNSTEQTGKPNQRRTNDRRGSDKDSK